MCYNDRIRLKNIAQREYRMFFKRSDIQKANDNVMDRVRKLNVIIGKADQKRFNDTIGNILLSRKYREGEDIDKDHMEVLKSDINTAIDNLGKHLVKNVQRYQNTVDLSNPVEYLVTAVDAWFVSAMAQLGCPNMPLPHFDPVIKQTLTQSAIEIQRSYVSYNISKGETFSQQRGKDAAEVSKIFEQHAAKIKGSGKPEAVGKMIAEYQALKERQNNHNVFWRIFHRTENRDRNELLKKMSEEIKKALPKEMEKLDLDKANPFDISRKIADARIRGEVEVAGPKRYDAQTAAQVFGVTPSSEEISEQQKLFDELSQKEPMSKDTNFINDIIGTENAKPNNTYDKESVNNDKVIEKTGNEFSLFN